MRGKRRGGSSEAGSGRAGRWTGRDAAVLRVADDWFVGESVYDRRPVFYEDIRGTPEDFIISAHGEPPRPGELFASLRWGGQVLIAHPDQAVVNTAAHRFQQHSGYTVEATARTFRVGLPSLRLPGLGRRYHYMVARKTALVQIDEPTDRFTFDVRLIRMPELSDGYVVVKQVPTYRRVVERLRSRFPEAKEQVLLERAEKLVKRVFPVFLTREAGFLQLIQRDMPDEYAGRVPRALGLERAPDGTVKRLYMSWLRLGGERLTQLEFGKQAADLLSVLHDRVGVIHLDLRLDNIVISNGEVCFIDFGSAVRVGEDFSHNPMLQSLFDEMMNTSQIQKTMGRMRDKGRLTSDVIVSAHGKIDKAVDLFYLSLQISRPVSNPDLTPFIQYDPSTRAAKKIKKLTQSILRPTDPHRPNIISARDVANGLRRLEKQLAKQPREKTSVS